MMRATPETIVVLAIALAGCGAPQVRMTEPRHESPAEAAQAFADGWNERDFDTVRAQFLPERRALLDRSRAELEADFGEASIADVTVSPICHPRGGSWKIVDVTYRSGAEDRVDAAWMHAKDGVWWMYSL